MRPLHVLFGILFLLQGCTYAISPSLVNRADKSVSFENLQNSPEAFAGKLFILGGIIDMSINTPQGTVIEIIEKPLDLWGKPERTTRTRGKFLLVHPSQLDAMVFAPGREVTIAGEVIPNNTPLLGDRRTEFPVLLAKEIRLWEKERPGWNRPQWFDPLYDSRTSGPGGPN